ncbi:hypothetical protein [Antarcticibacterium arcticum]|nr:hypothetical protein [Antarcticibacterium arcticum]
MENKKQLTEEGRDKKSSFAEIYRTQSRRPATPVPVFQGRKRYEEAEEEE